jgi:hypothetical protein
VEVALRRLSVARRRTTRVPWSPGRSPNLGPLSSRQSISSSQGLSCPSSRPSNRPSSRRKASSSAALAAPPRTVSTSSARCRSSATAGQDRQPAAQTPLRGSTGPKIGCPCPAKGRQGRAGSQACGASRRPQGAAPLLPPQCWPPRRARGGRRRAYSRSATPTLLLMPAGTDSGGRGNAWMAPGGGVLAASASDSAGAAAGSPRRELRSAPIEIPRGRQQRSLR